MKTKKKRLNDVKHGDIIATPVIYNGAIIVSKNTPIDDKVLERLQEAKIKTVKIQVEEEKAETNTAVDRLKNRYLDFNDQSSPSEVMAVIRQLASSDHPEFLDLIRLGFKKFKDDMIINEMIVQLKKYTPDRELLEYIYKYLFSDNRNIFQSALFILENNRENIMSVPYILKVYSMKEDDFYRDRIVSFFRRYDSNRLNSIFKKIFDSSNDRQVKNAIRDIVNMIKEPVSEKIIPLRDMEIPEYSMKSRVDSIVYYKATDLAIKDIDEAAEIFRQNYDYAANEIKDIYDRVTKGKTADVNAMKSIVSTLIDEIFYNKDMVSRMRTIFDGETYLYGHSLNVCILSVLTAIFLEYPSNKVAELGIAALMADVGMIRVKNTVWKEPRKLSHDEIEVIKYHIFDGLDTLKNSDDLKDVIATVALQHHEREDGTGYLGLRSSD
ncbi:MAG: HD-GYP domain-containing protein, partial [Candidatus Muiribacteriaceae bacterium]